MIAFYMDEQVDGAISRELRKRGIDVLTAVEDGHDHTPDEIVLDRASELDRLTFTKDTDFLREAHERQDTGREFAGVVFARQLGPSLGQCVNDLELIAKVLELDDVRNRVIHLPID